MPKDDVKLGEIGIAEVDEAVAEQRFEREQVNPLLADHRKSVILQADNLWDMCDWIIDTFIQVFPKEFAQFRAQVDMRRAALSKYGEPELFEGDDQSLVKNAQVRYTTIFPGFVVKNRYRNGEGQIVEIEETESCLPALKTLFKRHGFRNFPNADNATDDKMMQEFHRRYGRYFSLNEVS